MNQPEKDHYNMAYLMRRAIGDSQPFHHINDEKKKDECIIPFTGLQAYYKSSDVSSIKNYHRVNPIDFIFAEIPNDYLDDKKVYQETNERLMKEYGGGEEMIKMTEEKIRTTRTNLEAQYAEAVKEVETDAQKEQLRECILKKPYIHLCMDWDKIPPPYVNNDFDKFGSKFYSWMAQIPQDKSIGHIQSFVQFITRVMTEHVYSKIRYEMKHNEVMNNIFYDYRVEPNACVYFFIHIRPKK